jgi:drug/metabolite transporter (DMT)-like permease
MAQPPRLRARPALPTMSHPSTRGILYLCLGVFVFSLQDAVIKQVSGAYPLTQVVAIRSLVAIPLLLALVHLEAGWRAIASPQFLVLTARAVIMFGSYTAYYLAFPALPLADAVALYFTVPLFVTMLAAPMLGERSSLRVWSAVAIGFAGVLVMLRPGSGLFEPAALLSLLAASLYALAMLMARRMGGAETASVMAFYQNWVFLAGACAIALLVALAGPFAGANSGAVGQAAAAIHPSLNFLLRPWVWPTLADGLLIASCGPIAAAGIFLLTSAYRISRANLVTSFEYTGVLWAPLWGFLFFAEVPRLTTWLGALLIVGAGLLALRAARP